MSDTSVTPQSLSDAIEDRFLEAAREFVAAGRLALALASGAPAPEPMPSFWTEKERVAWERIQDAFRIDWLQTMWRLGSEGCGALRATVSTGGVPPSLATDLASSSEHALHWDLARRAIRLGHGSATFWRGDAAWTAVVEARLLAEWTAFTTGIAWERALPLVRYGWSQRRGETETADRLPGCPTAG